MFYELNTFLNGFSIFQEIVQFHQSNFRKSSSQDFSMSSFWTKNKSSRSWAGLTEWWTWPGAFPNCRLCVWDTHCMCWLFCTHTHGENVENNPESKWQEVQSGRQHHEKGKKKNKRALSSDRKRFQRATLVSAFIFRNHPSPSSQAHHHIEWKKTQINCSPSSVWLPDTLCVCVCVFLLLFYTNLYRTFRWEKEFPKKQRVARSGRWKPFLCEKWACLAFRSTKPFCSF